MLSVQNAPPHPPPPTPPARAAELPLKLWFFIRQGYRSTAQDMAASAQLDKDGLVSYLEINKISDLKAMLEG